MTKINDGPSPSTSSEAPKVSTSLVDEIYNERLKSCPNMPARPGDPHYVGQTIYDTAEGLLDLNNGKFTPGKTEINDAVKDLGKESALIKGAQADGKTSAQDILSGNKQGAEAELTKTIGNLKGNYYNSADRNDYDKALTDLKDGKTWAAEGEIDKAEMALGRREDHVTTASTDLTKGLKEFNSGKQNEGEAEMKDGIDSLHIPPLEHRHIYN